MQVADYGPPAVTVRMTRSYAPPAIIAKLESPFTHDLALRTKTRFAAETRECLRDRLSQLCKREPVAGALDLSWSAAHEAIEDLRRLGSTLSSSLVFDPTNGALFRRYLKQCLFQFRATHGPDTLPILQLEAPWHLMIPIEFFKLRTFDETKSFGHESILDLRNRARDLVGFNFAVRRKFPLQTIPALVSAKEKISMRFFWDCELDGAVAESKYLPGLSGHLAVEEPWPASKRHDKLAFVRMAYGAPPIEPLAMSLKTKGPPSDVWHLACHANTKAKNSVDYYLRLRGEQGGSFDVTLDDLQGGFSELMEDGVAPMEHKPFVFMNACGSSRLDPQVSSSFPSFWLENGFPGCIGTEIEVDDVVAARLSRYFYDAIVSGESLGTAMHRARMTLLERHRNPLGILWTLYANPRVVLVLKRGG